MNGFIISKKVRSKSDQYPCNIDALLDINPLLEHHKIGMDSFLQRWGPSNNDIHISIKDNKRILILTGYIVEIKNVDDFKDQDEALKILMASFENNPSIIEISRLLDLLHGSFGLFYRDTEKDITLCMTDRIASRPIWYFCDKFCWKVSSNATAIAFSNGSLKMDLGSVGSFLLYGYPVEPNKSIFSGVYAVPPGTIMRFGEAGQINNSQWYRFQHTPDNRLSMSSWTEAAAKRIVRAASRIIKYDKEPAIFFSGGVDSRLAAAAIKSAGGDPLLVTLGDGYNIEVRVAQVAARSLNLPHHVILRDEHYYLRSLRRAVFESSGSFLWTHGHFSEAAVRISKEYGIRQFFLGDFLECFSKLLCSTEISTKKVWSAKQFIELFDMLHLPLYRPLKPEATLSLLRSDIRAEVFSSLKRDLMGRYERVRSVSCDPLIVADFFLRWECGAIAPTFLMFLDLRSVSPERNLMFDKDLHELLEILPSEARIRGNLGSMIIKNLQPKAAKVMNSNSLLPVHWSPAAHQFSKKCKPFLGGLRRLILGKTHRTTGSWPEKEALYGKDAQWRNDFEEIFSETALFDSELFDLDAVRQCWKSFTNGNRKLAGDVEKLVQIGVLSSLIKSA